MEKGDTNPSSIADEPYPCEGCPYFDVCSSQPKSCRSFHIYVNSRRGTVDLHHRKPSYRWFFKTFVLRRKGEP